MADNENLNSENIEKNNKENNNSQISNATQNETKEEKSVDNSKKKSSKNESPTKKDEASIKSAPNIQTRSKAAKGKKEKEKEQSNNQINNEAQGAIEQEEKSNSNHTSKNSNDSFSKEESKNPEENEEDNENDNEDEKKPAPPQIINANNNTNTNNNIVNNTNNIIPTDNITNANNVPNNNINTNNNNGNNFLGKKHHPEKSTHLLADVIMKQEFHMPQKKASVQRNNSTSNNILDLIESDSESDDEDNEEKDKDEDYDINDNDKEKNKKKKKPVKHLSDNLDSKDKESVYYKDLRDLVNKNSFDKVLDCTFKIYNHEFSIKATNGKDYPILKKIYDISNKISKDSLQTLLIKILSNDFKETQMKLLDLIYKTKDFNTLPESKTGKEKEKEKENKSDINNKKAKTSDNNKEIKENKEKENNNKIIENEESNEKIKIDSELSSDLPIKAKSRSTKRNSNLISNVNKTVTATSSQPPKRRHSKKPSPPFYFGKHFYKKNNKVYCYVPKAKTASFNHYTLYCTNRGGKDICKAKIIIQQNDSKTVFIGNHICHPKLTVEDFYAKYPDVKRNDDWTHVQFAVRNDVPYIISQY